MYFKCAAFLRGQAKYSHTVPTLEHGGKKGPRTERLKGRLDAKIYQTL